MTSRINRNGGGKQKRPRGGQTKPPMERKRNNLTFRARDLLKQDLESAARDNQRSLSEEIEFRLERSLSEEIKSLGREFVKSILPERGHAPTVQLQQPAPPTLPSDFENAVYRAVLRALRDARDPDLTPEDSHRRQIEK